jgi:hypothetical protein
MAWFDPDYHTRLVFPFWMELAAFCRAINRGRLSRWEWIQCYWIMLRWIWNYKTFLFYEDLTYYPRQYVVRNMPQAKAAWDWLRTKTR